MHQMLTAAIERLGVDKRAALFEEGEQSREDRGHPGVEHCGGVRAFLERDQLLLEDLGVGVIEARIDQVGAVFGMIFAAHADSSEDETERAFRGLWARE